jgi:tetratricopeptide (TPR) repeat protein
MPTAPSSHDREILILRLTASHQWERLLETAREWLAERPGHGRAHLYAAQALVNLDRKGEAAPHLTEALARIPNNAFAHRMMSIVQFDLKNYRAADQAIQEAIALEPEEAMNWYQLALMFYKQHDLKRAEEAAARARELSPNNADILNLCALCAGNTSRGASLLQDTLELDPENAAAHNNLGVDYLNKKDYAQAEECFRRALSLDPTLAISRRNLFLALKHRDRVYRVLCAPRDFLLTIRSATFGDSAHKRNGFATLIGIIVWLLIFRFVAAGLLLWLGLVWPLAKFYEFLVIGDLRRKAGEIGATRGGILGYRRWPLKVRMGLFAAGLLAFWTGLYLLIWSPAQTEDQKTTAAGILIGVALVGVLGYFLVKWTKRGIARYHSWRRARMLKRMNHLAS